MTEKPRGEVVNPHVVDATLEPMPDFKAMQEAIDKCDYCDPEARPVVVMHI